ncbi:MAG TPA: SdrD B-like domain-containing protein [Dissulfurispiraceae bacterium]|nr:SdrD B-like domain-containing protein [Dissulfurispiraceae bacterium]
MANLAVTDTLPAGVTVPSGPNPVTTCAGATVSSPASNQVRVSGGTIAAASGGVAASCYAEIDAVAAAPGDYLNTIPAGGVTATSGGSPVSNSQPASDTLRAKAPLTVHKAIVNMTLDAGNPASFTTGTATRGAGAAATMTIRLDNANAANLTGAAFTDLLPSGLVVAINPNASTNCASGVVSAPASATSIRLTGATVPASGFCTVTVDVLSNISGSYTNTIPASAVTTVEGVTNEEPTSAQLIVSTPPTVSKQFSPAVIPPGGTSTLTIFLNNDNTSAITLSSIFTDTLPTAPGPIVVAATPNVVKTCPGAVTANAGNGSISYANGATIPAGGCTISVNVTGSTAGVHTNNIPAGALQTNLGNNQQPANATLTISTLGYVSGRVFRDNNATPNGTFEAGTDTPIAGVSIELHSGATCTGALVSVAGLVNPTVTDAAGNYLFAGLPAGTYSVCELVQPTGTVNGITTAGTITSVNGSTGTPGAASNPTASTSQTVGIVLNAAGGGEISGSQNNNFAEVVLSSISGTVFLDENNNGVQNGADAGIAGVTIELLNSGGTVIATTTTDANGSYSFTNLQPGTYSIREPNQPANTSNGITTAGAVPNGGTPGTATNAATLPSRISTIVLPPNTISSGNNFAEVPNGRRISGVVFLDYNNDGVINGSDHGIGSQTLNLTGTDVNSNAVTRTATTNADGTYDFLNLPEGTYTVTEPNQPAGTTNGQTLAGTTGGTSTAVGVTPSVISTIPLTGTNMVSANNNFAEIPGASPDLAIAKTHAPASLGASSSTGYFTLTPSNVGAVASSGIITVTDTLPTGITPTSATGAGWTCTIAGQVVTCTSTTVIGGGATGNAIIVRISVGAGLAGQVLTNIAVISGGGEPAGFEGNNTATDAVAIAQQASLQGHVWRDLNHDRVFNAGETPVPDWTVELLLNGVLVGNTVTAADGSYIFPNVSPGTGYQVRFREPSSGAVYGYAVPNEQGLAFTNGTVSATANPAGATATDGTLSSLTILAGANILQQSLPLDPSGVVYDAVTRNPVRGATVVISGPAGFDPANHLVGGAANASQVTGASGYYQFLLLPGAPAGTYTLSVTSPAGYMPAPSTMIPPTTGPLAFPATGVTAVQAQASAPASGQPTTYYFNFTKAAGSTGTIVNNHIPLDPIMGGAIVVTKTTPLVNVKKGDLVPYTITATNTLSAALTSIDVRDQLPPGFKYRHGSGTLNAVKTEPEVSGRNLAWRNLTFAPGEKKTFTMILVVGAGVGEGDYVNEAWAANNLVNSVVSNVATATVRVIPDTLFDCPDIIGKVFDDKNANGYQDDGEPGIANVRIATVRGLIITTDAQGRFHVPCPEIPNADRGSNFILKLDERTLPTGYRVTTENPLVTRITRGKMVKMNFGATVHRVVRIDVTDAAFVPNEDRLLDSWKAKIDGLKGQLLERPSIVRIAYRGGADPGDLAQRRIKSIRSQIEAIWQGEKGRYTLIFEEEMVTGK